jgi:hypothetical protein
MALKTYDIPRHGFHRCSVPGSHVEVSRKFLFPVDKDAVQMYIDCALRTPPGVIAPGFLFNE